jgi:hypothetical protein
MSLRIAFSATGLSRTSLHLRSYIQSIIWMQDCFTEPHVCLRHQDHTVDRGKFSNLYHQVQDSFKYVQLFPIGIIRPVKVRYLYIARLWLQSISSCIIVKSKLATFSTSETRIDSALSSKEIRLEVQNPACLRKSEYSEYLYGDPNALIRPMEINDCAEPNQKASKTESSRFNPNEGK